MPLSVAAVTGFRNMLRWLAAGAIGLAMLGPAGELPAASAGRAEESAVGRLSRALAAKEAEDGPASPYLLPLIERLAEAHRLGGGLDEAQALGRRALHIAVAGFGCDSAIAAEAMVSLALLAIDRRRYLDAEPLLIVAERTLSARVDPDHPALARISAGLARAALARGDTGPAEGFARRAVAIARQNPHNRSAEPLRALGAALTAAQHFTEAETVLAEAMAQDLRQHGADALETARSLSALGNLRLRQGRPEEALALLQQGAAIDQARLGPNHPFIADDLHDLGLAYEALRRPAEARRAFAAAVRLLERGAGRRTPRLAYAEIELSRLYRESGDGAAADAAFDDARQILNKAEAEERRRERKA